MRPTLVVMAAGMASRYGGLKQIQPVGPGGETIVDYSIFDALRTGFGKVVFVIRREIEARFKETIGSRFEDRVPVHYAFQESTRRKPWGTGHAVLAAEPFVSEPFAVINADDFYGAHSFELVADHLQRRTDEHAIVGYLLSHTLSGHGAVSRAVCEVDSDQMLRRLEETTGIDSGILHEMDRDPLVSMNMMGFTTAIFGQLQPLFSEFLNANAADDRAEFLLPTALGALVDRGQARVRVLRTSSRWFGVTYREDTATVREGILELVERGEYPTALP